MSTIVLLVVSLWTSVAFSAEPSLVGKIAGVYAKHYRTYPLIGEAYWSDDELLIAPYQQGSAYFSVQVEGENHHVCNLNGIAEERGNALVFTQSDPLWPARPCVLSILLQGSAIALSTKDSKLPRVEGVGGCKDFCGARADLDGARFNLSTRKKLGSAAKREASKEFKDAVERYRKGKAAGAP